MFLLLSLLMTPSFASTLDQAIQQLWQKDAMLVAQEQKISAAKTAKIARFLPSNPQAVWSAADNSSWHTYGASFNVGTPGKAFALSDQDDALLKAEERELFAKKIEVARYLVQLYSDCASGEELQNVLNEAVEEMDTLARTLDARYQMGQATQGERIAMQLQVRQARIEQDQLIDNTAAACQKLTEHLAKVEAEGIFGTTHQLPDDLDPALVKQMGSRSDALVRAENDERMAQVKRDNAWWEQAAPDFSVGIYRNYYDRTVASPIIPNRNTWTYTVGVTIPIFYSFTDKLEVSRQRADAIIAEGRARRLREQAEVDRKKAVGSYRRSKNLLERLRSHDLPLSEAMVDSTFAAYKGGKLGFAELLLAKRTWLDLKRQDVQLRQTILNSRFDCLSDCEAQP